MITEPDLLKLMSESLHLDVVTLTDKKLGNDVLGAIPSKFIFK